MILDRIFARSLENPSSTLADPAEWLYDTLTGGPSSSGVTITHRKALTYAAFWRGQCLLSRYVAKTPIDLFARSAADGRRKAKEHPSYILLRRRPNMWMTAGVFKSTLTHHALTFGNGYAHIFRDGDGTATDLVPMDPQQTRLLIDDKTGTPFYETTIGAERRYILRENMLHILGLSFDGLTAYSVLSFAKESLGLGIAARDFGAGFFKRGAVPRMVLEHPSLVANDEPARERFREIFDNTYAGIDNTHKTMILEQGMKANVLAQNAKDSQLLETRQFEIREVANWLGIPPHKLGDPNRTSYASLEQENQAFLDDSLDGWFSAWEDEANDKLLTEREKREDTHYFEFNRASLIRADITNRYGSYKTAIDTGWMNADEVRAKENLNSIDGGGGQLYRFPLNTGYVQDGAVINPNAPPPGDDEQDALPDDAPDDDDLDDDSDQGRAAARAWLHDCGQRIAGRISVHAKRAGKRPDQFVAWIESLGDDHGAAIDRILAPALAAMGRADGPGLRAAIVDGLSDCFLRAAEVTPDRLGGSVDDACATMPGILDAIFGNEVGHGTPVSAR